jgi:hypothetical protein
MYDALRDAAASTKRFTDRKRKESLMYTVGQKVWLDVQNLKTEHPLKKLDLRCLGPFEVTRLLQSTVVLLLRGWSRRESRRGY